MKVFEKGKHTVSENSLNKEFQAMQRSHGSRVIFHSTNERSHWIKDNISNPNLKNSSSLKNANLNNSILLKKVSYCYGYCSTTNRIFCSQGRALLSANDYCHICKCNMDSQGRGFLQKTFSLQCNTIQCDTIQYNTISTIQYNAMQCDTIQYNTIHYITI